MKTVTFRNLYKRVYEKDEGYEINAIVIFQKQPYMMNSRLLSPEEAREKGMDVENTVVQYRYRLYIDLWFIILRFHWEGKIKGTIYEKRMPNLQ